MRLLIILMLIGIIYSLASGLFYLTRDQRDSARLAKALTWRIGLSVALFVILMITAFLGGVAPGTL